MNAENVRLTTIEGHSNKTYLYSLMPKAYFGKKKGVNIGLLFPYLNKITTLLHKMDTKFTRLKHTKQTH